mmetsp:Transcript_65820/g.170882  ORF Transcript_65820/g.170882 Transcript_65820/m.170882 type:complete len:209 (-) Transcript_65820:242-868(-)
MEARLLHGFVLRRCRLHITPSLRPSVTKLHLGGEARGARAHAPCNDGLRDAARLDGVDEVVLVCPADLAQEKQHLGTTVVLVAEEVVQEAAAGVAVPADCHAFVDSVGVAADDVVQLVGHPTGLGDVCNRARAVQARHHDVVEHAAGVPNAQAAGFDATHGGWADHANALGLRRLDELTRLLLRNALCDDAQSLDARVAHGLHGSLIY